VWSSAWLAGPLMTSRTFAQASFVLFLVLTFRILFILLRVMAGLSIPITIFKFIALLIYTNKGNEKKIIFQLIIVICITFSMMS